MVFSRLESRLVRSSVVSKGATEGVDGSAHLHRKIFPDTSDAPCPTSEHLVEILLLLSRPNRAPRPGPEGGLGGSDSIGIPGGDDEALLISGRRRRGREQIHAKNSPHRSRSKAVVEAPVFLCLVFDPRPRFSVEFCDLLVEVIGFMALVVALIRRGVSRRMLGRKESGQRRRRDLGDLLRESKQAHTLMILLPFRSAITVCLRMSGEEPSEL